MTKNSATYLDRIIVDPRVLTGKPVIRGTRIPVVLILNLLAHGYDFGRVIDAYPDLTEDDVKAAIRYSAARVDREEVKLFNQGQ